jgi:hypothetical protein
VPLNTISKLNYYDCFAVVEVLTSVARSSQLNYNIINGWTVAPLFTLSQVPNQKSTFFLKD